MPRAAELARSLAIHSLAGFIAGVIAGGVGSRIAMRISAIAAGPAEQGALTEAGNVVGRITLGGTVALIVLGGLVGTAGGLIYLALRPWLADARRWRGLLFGVMLLAVLGPSIIRGENFDFYVFGPPLLNVTMFASLFILFGLLVPPLAVRLERSSEPCLRPRSGSPVLSRSRHERSDSRSWWGACSSWRRPSAVPAQEAR